MPERRKRPRSNRLEDFLDTPIYELVDRHRATLEKIKTRDDAEYWGHILIGEYYPEVPNSRSASVRGRRFVSFHRTRRTRANSERVVRDWSQETLREAGPVHVHPVSSATS